MNFTGNKNSIYEGSALVGNAKLVKALQKSIQATRTKKE